MFKTLCTLLLLSVGTNTVAATTSSHSGIGSCLSSPYDLTAQSQILNASAREYRARVFSEHLKKIDSAWVRIDFMRMSWSGLNSFFTHEHEAPTTWGLPDNRKLRVVSEHIYQKCANGVYEDWRTVNTDQTGCGEHKVTP